ncbi:MAG: hypothetical protein JXA33_03995, partial [Anaerolineae bacterium]|nr:hypothetical protein [Anaerolineae bacterium]
LDRAAAALESWETGTPLEPVSAEVQALRVGEWAIVTTPGEVFNQIGVQVKATSPFPHTFFVGYANGSIGYIPVPEAYLEGGYEVIHASQVTPEAAGLLTATCEQLLQALHAATLAVLPHSYKLVRESSPTSYDYAQPERNSNPQTTD